MFISSCTNELNAVKSQIILAHKVFIFYLYLRIEFAKSREAAP